MAGQTIINLGTAGSALNGRSGLSTGADSNDPKWLGWPGDNGSNYVYLPGAAGNFLSVADEASLDITGDIDLRAYVAVDDYTSGSPQTLISKWADAGNQRGYFLRITATGFLELFWSTTGADFPSAASTAAVTTTDGNPVWLRGTLDVNNGVAGRDIKFYTSPDGITWTQLGTTVTQATTTSVFANNASLEVGTWASGTNNPMAAKVYRAQVYNGIDGTLVLDVDTSRVTSGSAASFTARTGQTVTINRTTTGRKAVAVTAACWLFGTDDYMEVADNALLNFGANDAFTIVAVTRQPSITAAQVMLSKKQSANLATTGYALRNGATPPATSGLISDGTTQTAPTNSAGRTAGGVDVTVAVWNGATDRVLIYNNGTAGTEATTAIGSPTNSDAFRIGRYAGSGTSYADMELLAIAVFRRALTATEVSRITSYYQSRWL
jgi:hypothetical protein